MRHWLAGAAAFAMMTGVAFAEEGSTTTRSITTTVPAVGGYKSSEIHRDRDRNATRTRKTYHSKANGSTVTRTRTAMPDGSRTMSRETETAPYSGSSIEQKTTTTSDR